MSHGFTEASTIQAAVLDRLSKPDLGWSVVKPEHLDREEMSALIESDVRDALIKLNPLIAEDHSRVDQVLPALRATVLSAVEDGLVAANERMMQWLRGLREVHFVGSPAPVPVRMIDFEDPSANKLVVSAEVWFAAGTDRRRYDVVLWVNGFPLVVGETKTPTKASVSWLNGARDIHNTYEVLQPGFFVPNVLSFATEGKEFRYGPVRMPAEMWLPWGKTTEEPPPVGLPRALYAAELLLKPAQLLDILRSYTLFSTVRVGKTTQTYKVIPRYPQVEAVEALTERAADPNRRQGLIWHHQGSGKTLLSAFACGKLRRRIPGVTVIVLLDRLDLIEQTTREFESAGVERLRAADSKEQLRQLISDEQRGVILTTIFRFAEAGHLSDREDIVVIADEAHRTQEGILGEELRKVALPNATYIGMTGTPIQHGDRDTYKTFGDPDDPDGILNAYPPERSMADGATLPIRVEAPRSDLQLDTVALDEAFDAMADEEGLSEADKERLARKATRAATLLKTPKRVEAVCADIVEHYFARIEPLGLKAQVVAYDRDVCVAYYEAITKLIASRKTRAGKTPEATVVMTAGGKDEPESYAPFRRDRQQEAAVKGRFRDFNDPLQFIIVTAKLLTGFDAPIEGVMYLDKPLRRHTLFQALTRTNRRWSNPETEQEKTHGLIVDYIGLGKEIAASMRVERKEGQPDELDTETLIAELDATLAAVLATFKDIDLSDPGFAALQDAQQLLAAPEARDEFARGFLKIHGLWELLWPMEQLRERRAQYRWLAQLYNTLQPADISDALLWHRLGAKTLDLINEHIVSVHIRAGRTDHVTVDEETIHALRQLGFEGIGEGGEAEGGEGETGGKQPTAEELIDSVEERVKKKLDANPDDPKYTSLATRLDQLRQAQLADAADSIEWLKKLLEVARDVVATDREDADDETETVDEPESLLPEQRMGALTQIFNEYKPDATPDVIERVVARIDAVVEQVKYPSWQTSREGARLVKTEIRTALKDFGLPPTGDLFERAYDYVAEHY